MATSSSFLSSPSPLRLLRSTPSSSSSARLRPGTVYRHSPSARLQMQPTTKGRLKSVTVVKAASYEDGEAAVGHRDNDIVVAATTSLLHHVAGEVSPPNKGRPGGPPPPTEDTAGGGKIHHAAAPATMTFAKRERGPTPPGLPAEGSGGNGGSKH